VTAELIHPNGVDGSTGAYGLAPMTPERLAKLVIGEAVPDNLKDLEERKKADDARPEAIERLKRELAAREAALAGEPQPRADSKAREEIGRLKQQLAQRQHFGVKEGVDATSLAQAGWGVIFPRDANPAIKEALQPLLDLRAAQAGERFRLYHGTRCYRTDETKSDFLVRNGASPSGPADPDKVPYYLLIVGTPAEIPYSFQSQLDVQYAVGRLCFASVEAYADYARNVVDVETAGIARPKRLGLFGVRNADDAATELSARLLVAPLHEELSRRALGWEIQLVAGAEATRARLGSLMGGAETPALLFTASHGLEFPLGDVRQLPHQGALVCSDWPGPNEWRGKGPLPEDFYFAGDHLTSGADLQGTMVFCFACYGAGTPLNDEFSRRVSDERKQLAPYPFVSALPAKLLGRPRGALAVVGHVDRAWGCSFGGPGPRGKSYIATFQSALERMMKGRPVGYAIDYFNERYAELATVLSDELGEIEFGKIFDPNELAQMWTANNDAKGYVVLGDPAARLSFEGGAAPPVSGASAASASSVNDAAQPAADAGGRPEGISEADWRQTPESVRRLVARLRGT
jgi:hypothetical protein